MKGEQQRTMFVVSEGKHFVLSFLHFTAFTPSNGGAKGGGEGANKIGGLGAGTGVEGGGGVGGEAGFWSVQLFVEHK